MDAGIRIPFGLHKSGRFISVSEANNGLKCDCVCPSCKSPLVANQGDVKVWHFSHRADAACKNAGETAVHEMAKQIIADSNEMFAPDYLQKGKFSLAYSNTVLEKSRGSGDKLIRPDAICQCDDMEMFIEVAVEHFVDEEKLRRLQWHGVPTIEITVPRFDGQQEWSKERLEEHVISNVQSKRWVFLPSMLPAIEVCNELDAPLHEVWLGMGCYSGFVKISEYACRSNKSGGERLREMASGRNEIPRINVKFQLIQTDEISGAIFKSAVESIGCQIGEEGLLVDFSTEAPKYIEFAIQLIDSHKFTPRRIKLSSKSQTDHVKFMESWASAWKPILNRISSSQRKHELALLAEEKMRVIEGLRRLKERLKK